MYNTLLYIGLTLMAVGFVGWVVSIIMERHYEVKLWELEQKRKMDSSKLMAQTDFIVSWHAKKYNKFI